MRDAHGFSIPGRRRLAARAALVLALAWAFAAGMAGGAQAAAKTASSHKKVKTQPYGEPIDVDPAARACYKLNPGRFAHRCEPQSLPYGRCRTGNMTCRGNSELSPIGWYRCAERGGHATGKPSSGTILILGDNSEHRMNTGHVFVVEKARDLGNGRWELVLSHTNHDRRCSLETDVRAGYDEKHRSLTMQSGHWSAWGRNLRALGFIMKDGGTLASRP